MKYQWNYPNSCRDLRNQHIKQNSKGAIASYLTTIGSVSKDFSIATDLEGTDLTNAEIEIVVNGVSLDTERILEKLAKTIPK